MIKYILLGSCLLVMVAINAQQNKVKLGVIGIPFSQAGYVMGTIGFERLNKEGTASWQVHLNKAGGSAAADIGPTIRTWGTVERTFYFKPILKKMGYSISAFTEIGNRIKKPGHTYFPQDSVLQKTKAFEINPGISLGLRYRFSEIWGVELQAGPKMIIATGNEHYINTTNQQKFKVPDNEIKPGFMVTGSFYFQL